MRPYQHVLLATDLSEDDEWGAMRAAEIARRFHAQLTLLHVIPDFPQDVPTNPGPENIDPAEFHVAKARRALGRLAFLIGATRARQKVIFSSGSAKHAIVGAARDLGADLVLLAASGHHLMPALFSTTSSVLNDANCDVMVVRKTRRSAGKGGTAETPRLLLSAKRR